MDQNVYIGKIFYPLRKVYLLSKLSLNSISLTEHSLVENITNTNFIWESYKLCKMRHGKLSLTKITE